MKLLILGSTGGVGKKLVARALAEGHEVVALVRDPSKVPPDVTSHERYKAVKGQATSAADLETVLADCDAVLSALGPREKTDPVCPDAAAALVSATKKTGVKRVVWLSASGVGDSRQSVNDASFIFGRIILPLFLAKPYANHARAEETLRGSDLEWTVLRPLQLVDQPTGNPVTAVLPGSSLGGLKISRDDVAAYMLSEVADKKYVKQMPMLFA